ncbi:sporulation protein [Bacillus sp. CHD6a]|uniref:Sporulation protein n=2 Tax=Sutcliffiella horikoshii TaxID=79883 RepID=A0A5D4SQG6_9BACI|nr:sporulation protein [Bacillus sp. CHD6a]NLP49959.1 sporulation protein [Bacillus sp. RO1]NMH73359.1 sporulation protein [Bacillus sp. RO2]TYS65583.1 sporulation protein [Sutcliffiella horikoshii]
MKEKGGFSMPWWMLLIVIGIVFSAYMTLRSAKEEKEVEEAIIEKEGQVYMDRIQEEREKKQVVNV